jgi:hypothetical protein
MIDKLGYVFVFVISIFTFGFFKGKQNEKDKKNEDIIKRSNATKKRRNGRVNDTALDDLKWLQDHNHD